MSAMFVDTIAALASAPGASLRGIIRISGPDVADVIAAVLPDWSPTSSRTARSEDMEVPVANGTLKLPGTLLFWPTHRSFTGESLAEFHLPGSPPLLNEVLERVLVSGARPAERGEFTLRAFLAGRIDLVQAEAVLGVIDAGNTNELDTALKQLAGGISTSFAAIREELLLHLADLEAGLDFVEDDIEFVAREKLRERLHTAKNFFDTLSAQALSRMQSTGRARVVLAGLPNAGKSTLFNRLVGHEAALVSDLAGTTRDYLSAAMTWDSTNWELIDTAGWEAARDDLEADAGRLRDEQYQRADLILWCTAAGLAADELADNHRRLAECRQRHHNVLHVRTMVDREREAFAADVAVSAIHETNITILLDAIVSRLSTGRDSSEIIGATAARCAESLHHARLAIFRALELIDSSSGDELIAMELHEVLEHLGRITGRVYTDDILDRIFSRFCIGK